MWPHEHQKGPTDIAPNPKSTLLVECEDEVPGRPKRVGSVYRAHQGHVSDSRQWEDHCQWSAGSSLHQPSPAQRHPSSAGITWEHLSVGLRGEPGGVRRTPTTRLIYTRSEQMLTNLTGCSLVKVQCKHPKMQFFNNITSLFFVCLVCRHPQTWNQGTHSVWQGTSVGLLLILSGTMRPCSSNQTTLVHFPHSNPGWLRFSPPNTRMHHHRRILKGERVCSAVAQWSELRAVSSQTRRFRI